MKARDNPFRTERLESLSYRFLDGGWDQLWARLETLGGRGAIVGPRGSGKTTLLHEMAHQLALRSRHARLVHAPGGGSSIAPSQFWVELDRLQPEDALLIDGGERLSFLDWRRVKRLARDASTVVVTRHSAGALPTLHRTRTDPALLETLASELLGRSMHGLQPLHDRCQGDVRQALLTLYDQWALGAADH
jgi:hypothetical protein